jgi:hypothetical protein
MSRQIEAWKATGQTVRTYVDQYIHSLIYLHGLFLYYVFKYLNRETTSPCFVAQQRLELNVCRMFLSSSYQFCFAILTHRFRISVPKLHISQDISGFRLYLQEGQESFLRMLVNTSFFICVMLRKKLKINLRQGNGNPQKYRRYFFRFKDALLLGFRFITRKYRHYTGTGSGFPSNATLIWIFYSVIATCFRLMTNFRRKLEDGHKTETCSGYWIKYSNQCCVRRKPWTWPSTHKMMQNNQL